MSSGGSAVDEYLAGVPEAARAPLEHLREVIRRAAPEATESVSYGIAAFKQQGMLVGLGVTKHQCSFYLMSTTVTEAFGDELTAYDMAKGTIHFPAGAPLPDELVTRLVKARLAENEAMARAKRAAKEARHA